MRNLLFALILLPIFSFGQKIKFKKDKILFDAKEVAIFNSKAKTYNFSYLNGDKAFDAIFHGEEEFKIEGFQWVELISTEGVKTEIPYEIVEKTSEQPLTKGELFIIPDDKSLLRVIKKMKKQIRLMKL